MGEPIIQIRGLTKHFSGVGGEVAALENIDLEIRAGEIFGVIGLSGAGKSTLVRCVNLLERPTEGTVVVDGQDMTALTERELRRARKSIGMIFQSFNLLPKLTALENVALPLLYGGVKKAERLERARAALETVGLSDRVEHRPDQLSGGQCQRVAIARAIVGNPKLLLADEPTGALDSASGAAVMELFQQLHDGGSTIIMITHDHSIANHAAKVMTIRDGVLSGGDDYE